MSSISYSCFNRTLCVNPKKVGRKKIKSHPIFPRKYLKYSPLQVDRASARLQSKNQWILPRFPQVPFSIQTAGSFKHLLLGAKSFNILLKRTPNIVFSNSLMQRKNLLGSQRLIDTCSFSKFPTNWHPVNLILYLRHWIHTKFADQLGFFPGFIAQQKRPNLLEVPVINSYILNFWTVKRTAKLGASSKNY